MYFIGHEREGAVKPLIRFKNRSRREKFNLAALDLREVIGEERTGRSQSRILERFDIF